jgi:hypothetical protein
VGLLIRRRLGRRWRTAALAATVLTFSGATDLDAQGCASGSGRYTLRVQPQLVVFPIPTLADFETGWIASAPVSIRVRPRGKANFGWALCVRSDDPDMGGYGKPISDLEWRAAGQSAWQAMNGANQLISTGYKGDDVDVELRVRLDFNRDVPDTYSAVVVFETAGL